MHEITGHRSANTMKFIIKNGKKRKSMYKDIESFTERCETCLKTGITLHNTKNRVIKVGRKNEFWESDLIGRIPTKRDHIKFILVTIDLYTKWITAKIIHRKNKKEVTKALEEVIQNNEILLMKYSENGLEFTNDKIQELCR